MGGVAKAKTLFDLRKQVCDKVIEKLDPTVDSISDAMKSLKVLLYTWTDDYYMAIASLAALRSKDPKTPVGACVVDTNGKVVGIGYNAMPHTPFHDNDSVFSWSRTKGAVHGRPEKYSYVCHSAVNAIVNRTIPDLTGCIIYLTLCPDEDCAHLIAQSGIKEVKYVRNAKRGNRDYEENARRILAVERVSLMECNPKTYVRCAIKRKKSRAKTVYYVASKIEFFDLEKAFDEQNLQFNPRILNGERILIPQPDVPANDRQTKSLVERSCGSITEATLPTERPYEIQLDLFDRMEKGDAETSEKAKDHLVLSWEEFFFGLAEIERLYIDGCKVGACIVNPCKQVLAIGGSSKKDFEELGPGKSHRGITDIDGDPYAQHAEYKTIASYKGVETLKGCTLYVTTMPCYVCAKLIAQSGIVEVVYERERKNAEDDSAEKIFKNCSIICRKPEFESLELTLKEFKPEKMPLKWKESICLLCTKKNSVDKMGKEWNMASLLNDHLKRNEILNSKIVLLSVDMFSTIPLPEFGTIKVIEYIPRKKDSKAHYGLVQPLENGYGHFHKDYTNTKVTKDVSLCIITNDSISLDDVKIYFDIFYIRTNQVLTVQAIIDELINSVFSSTSCES